MESFGRSLIKYLIATFIGFAFSTFANAQILVEGRVYDKNEVELPNVNVIVRKSGHDKILAYTITKKDGFFSITVPLLDSLEIKFSHIGHKVEIKTLPILKKTPQISNSIFFKVKMLSESISLNEVILIKPSTIKKSNDTTSILTANYIDGTEATIEDLIAKIPGLNVTSDGTIKVGNQEIEKLMVDGDDFFERGYKVLSKNMPAYPVEEIEILKNYSNNRLLKNIEESDKVALNLKLNENAKRIWFGNFIIGLGNNGFYEGKANLMNFGKKNKYYFLTNLNNVGYDATGDLDQLIRPFRFNEPAGVGDNQQAERFINLLPNQFGFERQRTNFNNAEMVSLNTILNPNEKLKIKGLGFFNWDENDFFRNRIDSVNVGTTGFTNVEDYQLRNTKSVAFGKLDIVYNASKAKMFEATTKFNNGTFLDESVLNFNGNTTLENLEGQNQLFDQKIGYTHKYGDKKALVLTGRYIYERFPQIYGNNQFLFTELFPESDTAEEVQQSSTNQMNFSGVTAHWLVRGENDNLFELELGNENRNDRLRTMFSLFENDTLLVRPLGYQNSLEYSVNQWFAKNKYRYQLNKFGLTGKLGLYQFFNRLSQNEDVETQNPFFINPSVGLDWKISRKNKLTANYSVTNKNANVSEVFGGYVLNGFRSFVKGAEGFSQLRASTFVLNHQLGNWSDRFFANTFVSYIKNHDFFSTDSRLTQNFVQADKILIEDQELLNASTKVDYFLKPISSNVKLSLGYTSNNFKNRVNGSDLRTIISKNIDYGLELRSAFKGVFNYHIGSKWTNTTFEANVTTTFTDNISFLDLSLVLGDSFNFQLESERYFFGNLEDDNTYYFLDFQTSYQLPKNKLTLSLTGKNLFNTNTFRTFSVNDIGSSTAEFRLLPRYLMLRAEIRF